MPLVNPHPDSLAVHAGREDLAMLGVHALPLDLSSTNPLPDLERGGESYEAMATGGHPNPEGGFVYQRLWNPTVARFESALARLEHAETSVAYASGMAAMTAAIIASTSFSGKRHIVAVRPLYGGTDHLLASGLLGVEVTFCAEHEVAAAVRADTALVVLETPANPTLDLVDIAGVVAAAGDVPVLVDNTFATPVLQNPLTLGAAMSLHSATKYIGGHGDVVGGVIACDEETATQLRQVRAVTGGLLHPLGAYLLHRGLATLPTRVRAQQAAAVEIAAWLRSHQAVEQVYFPGLDDDRGLVGKQMSGPGAMVTIALRGGYEAAARVTSSVQLFTHAVSLGGVDSLIQHPAGLTHRPVAAHAKPAANLVRLSIGLESPEDLMADLDAALSGESVPMARAADSAVQAGLSPEFA
ncbi:aminotransferase class I/II-fold pyridoxal phosphate-dependent enzyme [Nocardioides sp. KC13]|uniref:homocysteine desulfhydrase n=1 Tax=Nocardioides turkmenicus TaxID=2711220 RepID=A0A6M1QTT7_9ACTN|nr:aminotransferase class I/II-fold pyridoxal phosphate-dependent enzyme [Nocardioides sp. KC13]NGN91140.1 aminotransferase class I/II-fold pyridoxal phosphate-dependent enzyme [Nocardioides sp. KC13]